MTGIEACAAGIMGIYRAWFRTLDLWFSCPDGTWMRPEQFGYLPALYAHSERDILVLAGFARYTKIAILVDRSRDGEWASRLLKQSGLEVIRGSSLHDGSRAFRDLLRVDREAKYPIAICVDGPLGPPERAKQGVVILARHTARPIVPVATATRYRLVIPRTWSGIFLPILFSKTVVGLGQPIEVPPDLGRRNAAALTDELTRRIAETRRRAEQAVRRKGSRNQ